MLYQTIDSTSFLFAALVAWTCQARYKGAGYGMKAVVNAQAVLPGAAGFVAREDMAILYDARL